MRALCAIFLLLTACSASTPQPVAEAGPTDTHAINDVGASAVDSSFTQTDIEPPMDTGRRDQGIADTTASSRDVMDEPSMGATGGCVFAMECAFRCNDDDTCFEDCLATVLPRNREVTERTIACARRNSCRDPQCLMRQCPDEADACGQANADITTPPSGDAGMPAGDSYSCADMIRCVNACGADSSCFNVCLERVRPQSSRLAGDLAQCMMGARCLNMPCGQQACPEAYQQCIDDD